MTRMTSCECHGLWLCPNENPAIIAVKEQVAHLPLVFRRIIDVILDKHDEYDGNCMGCYLGQDAHLPFPCPTIIGTIIVMLEETT